MACIADSFIFVARQAIRQMRETLVHEMLITQFQNKYYPYEYVHRNLRRLYETLKPFEPSAKLLEFIEDLRSGKVVPNESKIYLALMNMMCDYNNDTPELSHQYIADRAVEFYTNLVSGVREPPHTTIRVNYCVPYHIKIYHEPRQVAVYLATGEEICHAPFLNAYIGECCLFHITDQEMLFVGNEVYTFWLFGNDEPFAYRCVEHESQLKYYLICRDNTYLLTSAYCYISNEFVEGRDPYEYVYRTGFGYPLLPNLFNGLYDDLYHLFEVKPPMRSEEDEFPELQEEDEFPELE